MKYFRFYLPLGKAEDAHLLCCQGFAVVHYGFTLGRLEYEHPRLSLN